MLAKQVDAEKYGQIEARVTAVRWPRQQRVEDLKGFISLVTASLEGFVTEKDIRELEKVLLQDTAPKIDGSTAQDLADKGSPLQHPVRQKVVAQTAQQSTAEVIADLGNVMVMGYCGYFIGMKAPANAIQRYYKNALPNIKVIRLIEEGRKDPSAVTPLLWGAAGNLLTDYDKARQACFERWDSGADVGGTGDNDQYYNQYRRYEDPVLEFQRMNDVGYMAFYILANIGELKSPDLLVEWIEKEKSNRWRCLEMEVWMVDYYFTQGGGRATEAAERHAALTKGVEICGPKVRQSRWNAPWDVHEPLLGAADVDVRDIQTIEVLAIPPRLPDRIDKQTQEQIVQNFLDYAEHSKPGNYEEALRDPATFASMGRKHELIYTWAKECFGIEDLPEMYSLLNEDKHVEEWRFIAQLIGFVSDRGNRNSIDVLLKYLQRQDVWPDVKEDRLRSYDVGMGKILCLEWTGMIGGEYAEEILLKAITPEGAEELTKEWIGFTEVSYPGGREQATASIRGRAAMGLVFCQSAKGMEIVEQMYEDEKQKCVREGKQFSGMLNEMVSAMAYKALIDEHGLKRAFELYGKSESPEVISEYVKRYWLR
jgi:hypothetical protein